MAVPVDVHISPPRHERWPDRLPWSTSIVLATSAALLLWAVLLWIALTIV